MDADPRPVLEELTACEGWLRRMARGLVPEGGVDDLLQEVWLTSLHHQPRKRTLRAWLRAVMLNLFRDAWRTDQRRLLREARAAGFARAPISPEELAAREEVERWLRQAIATLKPSHRQIITLRFFEDRSAAEIARMLALPAGTVRRRLKEALAHLRATLDARHDGRRARWVRALLPLAAPQPPGPSGAGPAPCRPCGPGVTAGRRWLTVGHGLALGTAALVATGMVGLRAHRGDETATVTALAARPALPARPVKVVPPDPAPTALVGTIAGRVRDGDGRPAPGVNVTVIDRGARGASAGAVVTGADGRFVFANAAPGRYALSAVGERGAARGELAPLAAGATVEAELVLAGAAGSLSGRVFDVRTGAPVPRATVGAANFTHHTWSTYDVFATTTDDDGRYRLPLPIGRYSVQVTAPGYVTTDSYEYSSGAARVADLPMHPKAIIVGRLLDAATGRPVESAEVTAVFDKGSREGAPFTTSAIDAAGGFRLELPAGKYRLHARNQEQMAISPPLRVPAGGTASIELRLAPAPALRGRVIAADGSGVSAARVLASVAGRGQHAELRAASTSGDDGGFVIGGLPAGLIRLRVRGAGVAPTDVDLSAAAVTSGAPLVVEVVAGAVLRVRVRGRAGEPIVNARITARLRPRAGGASEIFPKAFSDHAGRAEIGELPAGQVWLSAEAPAGVATWGPVELEPGEAREVELALAPPAFVSGRVSFPDGGPAPEIRVDGHHDFGGGAFAFTATTFTDASGAYRVGPFPPGTVAVQVAWGRFAPKEGQPPPAMLEPRRIMLTAGARATLALTVPPRPGVISGIVTDELGQPLPHVLVDVDLEDTAGVAIAFAGRVFSDARGAFVFDDLLEGVHTLRAVYDGKGRAFRSGIMSGTTGLVLRLPPL